MKPMIHIADVQKLLATESEVAVSILMPLDRDRPSNLEDPRRFAGLIEEAVDALLRWEDRREAAPLVARLRSLIDAVDFEHPNSGLAVFVSEFDTHVIPVPFVVPARVAVARRFAVRDLLDGIQDHAAGRVLLLSERESHMFLLDGTVMTEVLRGGFPVRSDVEQSRGRNAPHRDLPIHETAHDDVRSTFRIVDRALDAAGSRDLPLIVVGVERDLSLFLQVSLHAGQVVGTIRGNHLRTPVRHLVELVDSALAGAAARRREAEVATLVAAVDARAVAVDILDVWRAAHEGRGRLLFVERGLELRGRAEPDHFELVETEPGPFGARLDDLVETVIAAVIAHGGEVIFVDPGELPEPLRIALVLRWPTST